MTYISARLRVTRESRPGKVARWRPVNQMSKAMRKLREAQRRYLSQ